MIFYRTFEHGLGAVWEALTTPDALHAFWLSLEIVADRRAAQHAVRHRHGAAARARPLPRASGCSGSLIDLPFAISPVVVGLSLVLVYGKTGWFGDWLAEHGIQVIFSVPGHGDRDGDRLAAVRRARDDPRAARDRHRRRAGRRDARRRALADVLARSPSRASAGASSTASCSRPRARSASSAPSASSPGRIEGQTQTLPLYVQDRFENFDTHRRLHRRGRARAARTRHAARDEPADPPSARARMAD